jgi:CrcB protein
VRVTDVLAVFVGGGLGSIVRYAVGLMFLQRFGPGFPYGTLAINLLGSFAIGVVAELASTRAVAMGPTLRLFFTVGVLGGFTTFSTFAYEAVTLAGERLTGPAAAYVALSVAGGILAAFAGMAAVRMSG